MALFLQAKNKLYFCLAVQIPIAEIAHVTEWTARIIFLAGVIFYATTSRLVVRQTKPLIQLVLGVILLGPSRRQFKLTTHLPLVSS
jgi:hypothetical protein